MVSKRGSSSTEVRPVFGSLTNSTARCAERRPVGVTLHHGPDDLRQPQPGLLEGRGDRRVGLAAANCGSLADRSSTRRATWLMPPSTGMSAPVVKLLRSDARNTAAFATSSAVP